MAQEISRKLKIKATSEIEISVDLDTLLEDRFSTRTEANRFLRERCEVVLLKNAEMDLKRFIDDRNKLTVIRDLRAHVAGGDRLRGKKTKDVAAKIADMTGQDVDWVRQQLARLDEEDAAKAPE